MVKGCCVFGCMNPRARNSDPGGPSGGQTFVFPADPNPLAWSNILKGTPARLPDDFNDRQITLVGGAVAVSTGGCRPSQQTITFPVYKTLAAAGCGLHPFALHHVVFVISACRFTIMEPYCSCAWNRLAHSPPPVGGFSTHHYCPAPSLRSWTFP